MDFKTYLRDLFARSATNPADMIRSCKAVLGSLPIVANALVAAAGKKVRLARGSMLGATDGTTIYLADLPIPGKNTDVDTFVLMLALAYGLIHHEIGHVNHTTFPKPKDVMEDEWLDHLYGIIEDVRQENCHIARFAGSRPYLDGLNAAMQITGHHRATTMQDPPITALSGYLLYRLYADYRGDLTVLELANQAEEVVGKMFPPGVLVRLETILPRMEDLEDSGDAAQLARDIRILLKDELKQAQQANQQQNQQQAQQGGQQQDQPQDPQQGQPRTQQSQQPEQGGQSQASDTASADASGGPENTGEGGEDDTAQRVSNLQSALDNTEGGYGDRSDVIARALNEMTDQLRQEGAAGEVTMTGSHLTGGVDDGSSPLPTVSPGYDMGQALSVTGQLRMKLVREMQAMIEGDVIVGARGRRISGKHLARVGTSDGRIFRTVDEDIEVDTAVCLAVDVSGSMDGFPVELASQALFACARALEGIDGVNVAATTFPGFQVVKPFGVKSRMVEDRFSLDSYGGTPMAEGITMAQRMLAATPEPRKVLLVVTDGAPNDRAATELAILSAEAKGVEVYGLGIMTDTGKDLFGSWQSIKQISDLPFTMIGLLRERLLDRAA